MPNLTYILTKRYDETFSIAFTGGPVELTPSNPVVVLKLDEPLTNIEKITTVTDETNGVTTNVYFKKYFKYENGDGWSDLLSLDLLSGTTFNKCELLDLELYYYRATDGNYTNSLFLDNVLINGEYKFVETDSEAILQNNGDQIILSPQDTYKIFKLLDAQVISNETSGYNIKYRFTQDNGTHFTQWEDLTKENISTIKLNPLRFAKVQYLITNTGINPLVVYDINLIGDFQNVSANYLKTNRYGLKQDCITRLQNMPGMPGSNQLLNNFYTGLSTYQSTDVTLNIDNQSDQTKFWNPYQFDKITQFANMLGNQVNSLFGWVVDYHLTDPDGNGVDTFLHEYTLKNIVAMKQIKVMVPDNKFPLDHMVVNQFNLDLFDTFEIHIMKDEFKNAFGIDRRPAEDDILYICEANMLFIIKHAQAFKNIMNAATYYKVILEKYEKRTNVRNLVAESQQQIDALTDNTTIQELLGDNNQLESDKIANKVQTYPTSFEKIRHQISKYVTYQRDTLYLDNLDFITSYYDLSDDKIKNKSAISYNNLDNNFKTSDDRSFVLWVNFKNKYDDNVNISKAVFDSYDINNDKYNFLSNYDDANNLGYEIGYQGGISRIKINGKQNILYSDLMTNVWYAYVINWNQRQKTLDFNIYRRDNPINVVLMHPQTFQKENVDSEDLTGLTYYVNQGYKGLNNEEGTISTGVKLLYSISYDIDPIEFTHEQRLRVFGSNVYMSNIRIFDSIIPTDSITNILKQNIIVDSQHLILADNANKQLVTTNLWTKNFR